EHVVVDLAARQHLGQGVADQLADAQLALRRAGVAFVVPVGHGGFSTRHPSFHPSSRTGWCEPKASGAPIRDLVRLDSIGEVPDSLACGSASGMTGALGSDPGFTASA